MIHYLWGFSPLDDYHWRYHCFHYRSLSLSSFSMNPFPILLNPISVFDESYSHFQLIRFPFSMSPILIFNKRYSHFQWILFPYSMNPSISWAGEDPVKFSFSVYRYGYYFFPHTGYLVPAVDFHELPWDEWFFDFFFPGILKKKIKTYGNLYGRTLTLLLYSVNQTVWSYLQSDTSLV